MKLDILSLFPEFFETPFGCSMIKRAIESEIVSINYVNIRDFSDDKHRRVDDKPFGGGPGMLMQPGPVVEAVESVKKEGSHVIYLSPQGKTLTAKRCQELSSHKHLVVLCGHYEGIDQRAIDLVVDEEISIGDYILTSGEPAAVVLVNAVLRFVPGVLGDIDSALEDSFHGWGGLKGPSYTRPREYRGLEVPQVLLEGNHQKVNDWRREKAQEKTLKVRPELI